MNKGVRYKKIFLLFLVILLSSACAPKEAHVKSSDNAVSKEVFAMDTYMTLTCYGTEAEEAADAAIAEIQRLDALLSVGNENSEISMINRNNTGMLDSDGSAMVEEALKIYEETNGAFDISVYPLMELWGFTDGNFTVPREKELQACLELVGSDLLSFDQDSGRVTLHKGQGIDLGGIAKGYTSDRIMDIFKQYKVVSGVVSLGGNVQCYGTKPDGSKWRCGIQSPIPGHLSGDYVGIVEVADCAVITSGGYERFFTDEETGKTYHHILNPTTGYPAENGLLSVTIVTPDGMLADALSTACYVLGLEQAIDYWRSCDREFDMILMDEDQKIYITEGIKDSFESDFSTTVVTRF